MNFRQLVQQMKAVHQRVNELEINLQSLDDRVSNNNRILTFCNDLDCNLQCPECLNFLDKI